MPTPREARSVAERFWENVRRTESCWLWQGYGNQKGYGWLRVGSRVDGSRRNKLATHISWELHFGPVPDGKQICHTCDEPRCVNPEHLWVGTNDENVADKMAKGRQAKGAAIPNTVLCESDVRTIKEWFPHAEMTKQEFGEAFDVSHSAIRSILTGRTWAYVLHDT